MNLHWSLMTYPNKNGIFNKFLWFSEYFFIQTVMNQEQMNKNIVGKSL